MLPGVQCAVLSAEASQQDVLCVLLKCCPRLCMTRDMRGVRPSQPLSPARLGPAAALAERGTLKLPSSVWVPGVSEGKSTWNISLQNTSPACLTVSFTGLLQQQGHINWMLHKPSQKATCIGILII